MAKSERDDEDMAPAPAPRGSPPSATGRRRAPPKRKADEDDKGDARARRRRAREPSARTKAQDPLGAATRFVDLTRRLAAGGADASPGLELEALAKLLYALTQRTATTEERSLSARALLAARDALLALSSQRSEDDDAAPASRTRAQKAIEEEDQPQPLDKNAQLCAGAALELCVELCQQETTGVVTRDAASQRRASVALDVLEELCGGASCASVDLAEEASSSRIAPFEDVLATTLHAAAARCADKLRRVAPSQSKEERRPSPVIIQLAAANLSRLEAPQKLLRCADTGLRIAGGHKPDDTQMEDQEEDGDRNAAMAWASRLARVARLVEDERADELVTQNQRNAVEQACFDVAARLGAVAALSPVEASTIQSGGWREQRRKHAAKYTNEEECSEAVRCFADVSFIAQTAKPDSPQQHLVDAIGAAAIFRACGPLSSAIVEGTTTGEERLPCSVAAFALTAVAEASQHNCTGPLAQDALSTIDGCCACALAGAARSQDDDLATLGLKALAALLGPPQEKAETKKRRRAVEEDGPSAFRDVLTTDHALAVLYATAWDSSTDLPKDSTIARRRARGDRAWLAARSASRAVADSLTGESLDAARNAFVEHMAQDDAIDMAMPRKAFSTVYDLVLDRGEGDNQHLAKVASLLFGDDAEVCPLGYAPHGARFLVDALSSPRRDAFASAVGEKLWEHITKLNDDDDLQTAARLLHVARASLDASPTSSSLLADRLRAEDDDADENQLYAALKGFTVSEPPKRVRRRRAPAAKKVTQQPAPLVEGKRITELRSAAVAILKSAREDASHFAVDAAWRFLASLPECSAKDGLDGALAAARLAKLLDASESRLAPGDAVLTAARTKLRSSLNEAPSWASQAAVEALAFALRAAVVPSRGGRYRLEDGDSDVDDGSDSEGDDETSDEAARRARTSAFVEELVEALSTVVDAHDADVLKRLEGEEPSKRRRKKADDDPSGDARLARCLLRAAGGENSGSTPHAQIFEPPLSKLARLGRALFGENGSSEDSSTVKPLVDRLARRSVDVKAIGAELKGTRGTAVRKRCSTSVNARVVAHALSQKPQTARVVSAVAAAARAVAVSARRQHLRSGTSQETSCWISAAAALGALKTDAAYAFMRGLCANAQQQLARRPSDARAVDCRRRLGATCVLFDNQAKSEGVWCSARAAALDDLERWTSSPRAEHRQHVVSYVENTSDESVGAEKLLSWALKDDLSSQGGHLAIAARIVVTASQFPDATSGSVRLPAAKAFAGAPPGSLRAALIAAKHETASICELCASSACGDAKGVDGRYPAATGAASFVAGRGDEDAGWAPQKTAKKGNEVWASACRTAVLRAIVDDGEVTELLELPARASRPCESLLVLCAVTNGGSAAADVAQRLVQSGKTLGSARALELAAALCAGFRRALGLRQEEQTLPVQEEEEEPQREVPTKCTFASTSGAFVEQHWYNCATCGLVGDKGACAACIRTCHAGHDISYARKSSFFCDCGARGSATAADRAAQRERESFLGGDIPGGRRGASAAALLAAAPPCRCLDASERRFRPRAPTIERRPPKQDRARLLRRVENLAATTRQVSLPASLAEAACAVATELAQAAAASLAERPIRSRASSIVQKPRRVIEAQPSPGRGRTSKGSSETAAPTRSAPKVRRASCVHGLEVKVPGEQTTGPVARQTKALLQRHRLAPRLVSADRRGRVAIGCRRTVTIYVLENALRARRPQRTACIALTRANTPFDLVGLAFNPCCDRHVACWGLRDCCVVALDGGDQKKSQEPINVKVELALDALASDAAHVVKCLWVPSSKCGLAVCTTLGVHIYDLSRDTATPTHAYVLAYDQHHLRDACLAPPRPEWGGARALYAVLDTGRVFAADVEPDDNELFGRKATIQTAKEVYLDLHDALSLPPRLFTGAGCAHGLLYSSRAHALVIARDGCAACVIPLGDGVRDVRGGGHILPCTVPPPPRRPQVSRPPTGSAAADELLLAALNASQTQQKTAQQPFDAWLEWPGAISASRRVVVASLC